MQVPFLACLAAVLVFAPAVRAQGDCANGIGLGYYGTVSTTTEGLTCQRWDSQEPHAHSMTNFPNDESISAAENYCRNPDEVDGGLWCYTEDWWTRWQYCDVPACPDPDVGCMDADDTLGENYMGGQSTTNEGLTCQRWDAQSPHGHSMTDPDAYPDASIEAANNYCRNPDGGDGPWCYTTDWFTRWQYCDVSVCDETPEEVPEVGCMDADDTLGENYMGGLSTTVGGLTCQRWDEQSPHVHGATDPDLYPDESLEAASNYCRNPDGGNGPWCYTTDWFTRWQYCDVPVCATETPEVGCMDADDTLGENYMGGLSTTNEGLTCQRWDEQLPHIHLMTDPDAYPDASIEAANNYCRNPDGGNGPWCYTTELLTRWQYCDVPVCDSCENTMNVYEQMHAEGGEGVEGIGDIDSCNALCFADTDCLGVDYDISSNPWRGIRCWLHIGDLGSELTANPTVNHYEVAVRC